MPSEIGERQAADQPHRWRYNRSESELVVAAFRLAFTLLVLLSPVFTPLQGWAMGEFRVSAIAAAIYSAAVPILHWKRWGFRGQRYATLAIDLLLVTMWVYLTSDYGPRLSSLYYGLVAVAALWFGMTGALATAASAAVLYGSVAVHMPSVLEPAGEVLGWRIPLLFLMALLVGYMVESQNRERARWQLLEEETGRYEQRRALMQEVYEDIVLRPAGKEWEGLEVGLRFRPAWRYGAGDYFDIMEVGDKIVVVIGDVAGTYSPGLKRVLQLKYSCLAAVHMFPGPGQVLTWLNRMLFPDLQPDQFVSLCCVYVNKHEGSLTCANAGHESPLLVRAGSREVERLERGGMVLGVMPDTTYEEQKAAFSPGDLLLLYTDGVTGATSPSGEEFGLRRVELAAVSALSLAASADKIAESLFTEVGDFSRKGPRRDDVTVLAVRLVGAKQPV